jgi:RNA polymerase sigma factor (sigma-70 family)
MPNLDRPTRGTTMTFPTAGRARRAGTIRGRSSVLVERFHGMEEVVSSSLIASTSRTKDDAVGCWLAAFFVGRRGLGEGGRYTRPLMGLEPPESRLSGHAAGREDVVAAALASHLGELRGFIERRLPRRHRAVLSNEDVLQQTLVDAFREGGTFPREAAAARAWLWRVAERNLIDAVRMLDADKRGGAFRQVNSAHFVDDLTDGRVSRSPRRAAALHEAQSDLARALDLLPSHYAQVIRGYDLEGQAMGDVAGRIQRTRGAAFMLRARALRHLRELMGSTSRFFSSTA